MKTLNWIYMQQLNSTADPVVTLIERMEEDHLLLVWGICVCYKEEGESFYQPVTRSPDRKYLRTILERMPLEEAKEAVEKKLLNDGVLQEGDTIRDYLDP